MKPHEKPYPLNCNREIYRPYIGKKVVNVHNPQYGSGTIRSVQRGCNGLILIQWSSPFPRWYAPQDLALAECWPEKRWSHE